MQLPTPAPATAAAYDPNTPLPRPTVVARSVALLTSQSDGSHPPPFIFFPTAANDRLLRRLTITGPAQPCRVYLVPDVNVARDPLLCVDATSNGAYNCAEYDDPPLFVPAGLFLVVAWEAPTASTPVRFYARAEFLPTPNAVTA